MKNHFIKLLSTLTAVLLLINSLSANKPPFNDHNTINLIGQTQSYAHMGIENIKKDYPELASGIEKNTITFALQGKVYNKEAFGIEDPHIFNFALAYTYYYHLVKFLVIKNFSNEYKQSEIHSILLQNFNQIFPSFIAGKKLISWSELLDSLPSGADRKALYKKYPEITRHLTNTLRLRSNPIEQDAAQKIGESIKTHSFETPFFMTLHPDLSQWINFFKDLVNLYGKKAMIHHTETIYQNAIKEIIDHINQIDYEQIPENTNLFDRLFHDIMYDLAPPISLKNIINIFENAQSQEKPFYLMVDETQVLFFHEQLTQKGYKVLTLKTLTQLPNKAEL